MEITPTTKIQFKIVDTTDNKYEGELITHTGPVLAGETVSFKDVTIAVEKVQWPNEKTVKLVSSNYIAVLEIVNILND
jgi:hypothetical protein